MEETKGCAHWCKRGTTVAPSGGPNQAWSHPQRSFGALVLPTVAMG